MLMWISGAVLVVGAAIFLGVFFGRGSSQDVHTGPVGNVSSPNGSDVNPITGDSVGAKAPVSSEARTVARTFLETAVVRKNLGVAWGITGPWLKGESKAQWVTGDNPVAYFPAINSKTAAMKVLSSTKNALLLEVGPLVAPAKAMAHDKKGLKPLTFKLEVDRLHGKWLVNYFMPNYPFKRLAPDSAGTGGN